MDNLDKDIKITLEMYKRNKAYLKDYSQKATDQKNDIMQTVEILKEYLKDSKNIIEKIEDYLFNDLYTEYFDNNTDNLDRVINILKYSNKQQEILIDEILHLKGTLMLEKHYKNVEKKYNNQ